MKSNKKITVAAMALSTCFLIAFIAHSIHKMRTGEAGRQYREARLKTVIWPVEKRQTAAKVKARQAVDETHGATLIDLKPFLNAKLDESPLDYKGRNMNNLGELPIGTNIYAGVPFDVEGSIQLMGGWLRDNYHKEFQSKVENIPVKRKCQKIHLLHGDAFIPIADWGKAVSTLVLHYSDGSKREISLISGKHSLDWWAPTYRTGVDPSFWTNAPGTELAWVGSNPAIRDCNRQWNQDYNLCLYKTTLENPQPEVEISTVDYVSTLTETCPFLLGITVE